MAVTQQFQDTPRNGGLGDRPYSIIDFAGPASYVQMVPGTANVAGSVPTGGQPIGPSNFGLSAGIEAIITLTLSSSGNYNVDPVQLTSYNQGFGNTTWALVWTYAPGNNVGGTAGGQVNAGVALNNEIVRLIAIAPY